MTLRVLLTIRRMLLKKLKQWVDEEEWRAVQQSNADWINKMKSTGEGFCVNGSCSVSGPEAFEVGNNVHIGNNAFIRAEGGLSIGDNTHISRNLVIYTVNHDYQGTRLPYDDTTILKPVTIGRNVWIGMNVCIAPGTTIEDGAIVAMGAVVSGRVPALSIVGSAKASVLKHRSKKHYDALDACGSYGGINGRSLDS